jgi:hypothetical protein
LVSTDPRLVFAVFNVAVWPDAELAAGAADVLGELAVVPYFEPPLPQAASSTAKTANAAGIHLL